MLRPYWSAMKIKVSKKHIQLGEPGDGAHCPIALAIREQVGKAIKAEVKKCKLVSKLIPLETEFTDNDVSVDGFTADIKASVFELPQVARDFVTAYDTVHGTDIDSSDEEKKKFRKKVKPFSFDLPL